MKNNEINKMECVNYSPHFLFKYLRLYFQQIALLITKLIKLIELKFY